MEILDPFLRYLLFEFFPLINPIAASIWNGGWKFKKGFGVYFCHPKLNTLKKVVALPSGWWKRLITSFYGQKRAWWSRVKMLRTARKPLCLFHALGSSARVTAVFTVKWSASNVVGCYPQYSLRFFLDCNIVLKGSSHDYISKHNLGERVSVSTPAPTPSPTQTTPLTGRVDFTDGPAR